MPTIVWVGRLEPQKRPDIVLDAFFLIQKEMVANLWICGDGSLKPLLVDRISRSGAAEAVTLTGYESNPFRWIRNAEVFVLTSDFEGLPNALIEAQSLGVPAVSTRCPTGPDEIIDNGKTGILVPVNDPDAIAAAVISLLRDPERRAAMGRAARKQARQRFAIDPILRSWEGLLEAACLGEAQTQVLT